jgi:hypothetical protein
VESFAWRNLRLEAEVSGTMDPRAGRPAPPLVAHTRVALSDDWAAITQAARQTLAGYARLPFYAQMFAAAGYPVGADGSARPVVARLFSACVQRAGFYATDASAASSASTAA